MKITELSISWIVSNPPATPISDKVILMIDPRSAKNVERAVSKKFTRELPDWMVHPKTNNLRFLYDSSLQSVECTYNSKNGLFTCGKIKYDNLEKLESEGHLADIFDIINTAPEKVAFRKYKASEKVRLGSVPWNKQIFADVVTNDARVARVMALREQASTMNSKSMFSIVVDAGDSLARVTLTPTFKAQAGCSENEVTITMSRLEDTDASFRIMSALNEVFDIYKRDYGYLAEIYRVPERAVGADVVMTVAQEQGIKKLRQQVPDLFINNYTRECPILPIMVSQEEADLLILRASDPRRTIFYPLGSEHGRYYTAPEGYFVGLKRNRLKNKDKFPFLVTCYLYDHMEREGSETYRYYKSDDSKKNKKAIKSKSVPRSVIDPFISATFVSDYQDDYIRVSPRDARSFISALEKAVGEQAFENFSISGHMPYCPQLVRQEMWNETDEAIAEEITNGRGSLVYRYFEELLRTSIHVVVIEDGKFQEAVPNHERPYIWTYPYSSHVVVFENVKKIYGETRCWYEVLSTSPRAPPPNRFIPVHASGQLPVHAEAKTSNTGSFCMRSDGQRPVHAEAKTSDICMGSSEQRQKLSAFAPFHSVARSSRQASEVFGKGTSGQKPEARNTMTIIGEGQLLESMNGQLPESMNGYEGAMHEKVRGKRTVFPTDDPIVASIISQKSSVSVRPPDVSGAVRQLIDDRGKCRIIELADGTRKMTITRPLPVDVITDQTCFYDRHIEKLNKAKENMGVQIIDLKKRSNNNVKYFSNESSFLRWKERCQ